MLSNFITNIMAAIFDFNGSGRLGRGQIYTKGAVDGSKIRTGVGVGESIFYSSRVFCPILQNDFVFRPPKWCSNLFFLSIYHAVN